MDYVYLTIDQVVEIHDEAIREFGGIHGLRSQDLLESSVLQPQQSAFSEDAYPTLASKAAAYAYFICLNHPFLDGNKRTAVDTMLAFLYLNACQISEPDDALENVIVAVAAKDMSKEDFFLWVEMAIEADSDQESTD